MLAIEGASGAGKSTLLHILGTLDRPTEGTVHFQDQDLLGQSETALAAIRNRHIGFVFQFHHLLPEFTALENVAMPSIFRKQPRQEAYARATGLLEMLGLSQRMEVYPKQLSAGEQKRAVIARSLVNQPEILLADEPTSDLDEKTELEIMDLLKEIHAGGVTIVMVTHSLQLISYATRALKMENGTLAVVKKRSKAHLKPLSKSEYLRELES